MKKYILLSFILLLALSACNQAASPTPAAETTPGASGYPYPVSTHELAYPLDDLNAEAFYANLTPNAPAPVLTETTGAFTIKLFYPDSERPVRGQILFAAEMLAVQGTEGFIPKLDTAVAPRGSSDSVGVVVISGILPGKYALALMTPLGPILVEDVLTGETIIFDIVANQLTDAGTVNALLNPDVMEP